MVTLGGVVHFGVLQMSQELGLDLTPVGYRGAPPMRTDEIGGVLPVGIDVIASASELVKAGKLKYLGLLGTERSPLAPEVSTMNEQGVPGFDNAPAWFAAFAPASTPQDVVQRLQDALIKIVREPEFGDKMALIGLVTTGQPGATVTEMAKTQREALRPVVERSGFRATQ